MKLRDRLPRILGIGPGLLIGLLISLQAGAVETRVIHDYTSVIVLDCDFNSRPGRAFQFSTADPILQPYGFVLWKTAPSISKEPLDYASYHGRHGKLTGRTLIRDGVRWFEGVLEDCSPIFAEDASTHSHYVGVDHLAFHGKIIFKDTHSKARQLIGRKIVVKGDGLEPNHRLYTTSRNISYPLNDEEKLEVLGIDTHRYAFAKGVGPFFLKVQNAEGNEGLIKFNPEYIDVAEGEFPVQPLMRGGFDPENFPGRNLASAGRSNTPASYILTVSHFNDHQSGLAAEQELEADGFNASLLREMRGEDEIFKLQIDGLPSLDMANSMAAILAQRFGWVRPRLNRDPAATSDL